MDEKELLRRITTNPRIMLGKPTIRGSRLTVDAVLEMLAAGVPETEILAEYHPLLEPEDIRAVWTYVR
ncbi:MAG: DUF433 domain-containing protein [Chloroflexi bacterium]|nr:DUF433 domain-containing protein [Chloroflexota bacterium]